MVNKSAPTWSTELIKWTTDVQVGVCNKLASQHVHFFFSRVDMKCIERCLQLMRKPLHLLNDSFFWIGISLDCSLPPPQLYRRDPRLIPLTSARLVRQDERYGGEGGKKSLRPVFPLGYALRTEPLGCGDMKTSACVSVV